MTTHRADLLVTGGIVVTMDAAGTCIADGGVAVASDRIAAVGEAAVMKHWTAPRVIDARGGIIMPGLINTHTHAAMTCFRGLADDLPLMDWLQEHIFPAEARLDEKKVYRASLLACAEMIRSGTTTFCDMYLFEDAVARAASTAGMRAVVGEVLYDFPSPNYGDLERGFAYTEQMIDSWQDDPLITVAVEPHSPYLCAPELLQRAAGLAGKHGIPLVIHVSETRSEVQQMKSRYGRTPVGFLAEHGILSANLLACHCVVLTEEDLESLQSNGVKVAHNPESNMKLASGIAPVPEMLGRGICVGLGTDGCASNNNLDLFLEMSTAAKLHKVSTLDPTVLDAETVLRMATIDGARALGIGGTTGSIEKGKAADIIVIDTEQPHLTPMYNPISHLVYAAGGGDVTDTIVNGRVVMENRRLRSLDVEKVMDDVQRIADEIRPA